MAKTDSTSNGSGIVWLFPATKKICACDLRTTTKALASFSFGCWGATTATWASPCRSNVDPGADGFFLAPRAFIPGPDARVRVGEVMLIAPCVDRLACSAANRVKRACRISSFSGSNRNIRFTIPARDHTTQCFVHTSSSSTGPVNPLSSTHVVHLY